MRRHHGAARALALASALVSAGTARAGGGAHVIDDAGVETAGGCHLESWRTEASPAGSLSVLAPACTPRRLPFLELGGSISRDGAGGRATTLLALAPKLALPLPSGPIGIALSANVAFDPHRKGVAAALTAPVSIALDDRIGLNLNAGLEWTRGARPRGWAGAQIEAAVTATLSLMAEAFTRPGGRLGRQAGLRFTVDRGRIDIDLLAAHRLDGRSARAITLGVTIRR